MILTLGIDVCDIYQWFRLSIKTHDDTFNILVCWKNVLSQTGCKTKEHYLGQPVFMHAYDFIYNSLIKYRCFKTI